MKFDYITHGTCSTRMSFDIENNIINSFTVENGCNGNLQGIKRLIEGMNIDDVINKLDGIKCGNKNTSCPDQISKALKQFKVQ